MAKLAVEFPLLVAIPAPIVFGNLAGVLAPLHTALAHIVFAVLLAFVVDNNHLIVAVLTVLRILVSAVLSTSFHNVLVHIVFAVLLAVSAILHYNHQSFFQLYHYTLNHESENGEWHLL